MKVHSVQFRFTIIMLAGLLALMTVLWLQARNDRVLNRTTAQQLAQEKQRLIEQVIAMDEEPLRAFVADYAAWDEMVRCVAGDDLPWAAANIEGALKQYRILDGVWILRTDGTQVYAAVRGERKTLKPLKMLPLPPDALARLEAKPAPLMCFVDTPRGLLHLYGEPIRPSDQADSYANPQGWLFAIRLWDSEHVNTLSKMTGCSMQILKFGERGSAGRDGRVATNVALRGWDGLLIGSLYAVYQPLAMETAAADNRYDLVSIIVFALLMIVLMMLASYYWILRPLRQLSQSLIDHDLTPLQNLISSNSEFGALGRLVAHSFEQEKELRQAFDVFNIVDDAVFIINEETYRTSYVNSGAVRLLQYSAPELRELMLDSLMARKVDDCNQGGEKAGDGSLAKAICQTQLRRKDQSLVEVEIEKRPLETSGAAKQLVVIARDISERKLIESEMRQAQKMEAVGTLAGGVAHDFNNILGAIVGYTELAKLDAEKPEQVDNIEQIMLACKRARDLVRQILAFSRQHEQQRQPIQLRHVIEEAMRLLRAALPSTLEFKLRLAKDAPVVLADPTQIHQVVMNLCTNAAYAMEGRMGLLEVELDTFVADAKFVQSHPGSRLGSYSRLTVRDSGVGMDQATLGRIYEPFFTTKPPGQGSGLGLAVVHGIVLNHEGLITVESVPGLGTTFQINFPSHVSSETEEAEVPKELPPGGGHRILVLDDEKAIARTISRMLERQGYVAEIKTDVAEAIREILDGRVTYDLVITDLTMPGMTGLDFAREILQKKPYMRIVVMTGYASELTTEKVQKLGIKKILQKPISMYALGETVASILNLPAPR